MPLLITGATIIDAVTDRPLRNHSILVDGNRIKAIAPAEALRPTSPDTEVINAQNKYVIPGLMNANVHLLGCIGGLGELLRYIDCYEEVAIEAAQIALRNGLTTVFDTAAPRKPLIAARDRINSGDALGSRVFCAGWIIGLDGILSLDFNLKGVDVLTGEIVERINALCAENVGPALSWMSASDVAHEVAQYIEKGVDFIKYASGEHRWGDSTSSLIFSPRVQRAIVDVAHRAHITAQAHPTSGESLHAAVEAGCDLVQHPNITGRYPISSDTLELMAERKTGAAVFPLTQQRFDWLMANCDLDRRYFVTSNLNCKKLLEAGAMFLLANDATVYGPDIATDPFLKNVWVAPGEDNLNPMEDGHFVWLKAMEEIGMRPLELLRASTRNIAVAYGKERDLGTLEVGKLADLLILTKDPLMKAENYRSIETVVKDGQVINRDALPLKPLVTKPLEPPSEDVLAYRAHKTIGMSALPPCALCRSK